MARDTFQIGDLTAVIGDNEAYEGHRAGYNGVHRLTHRTNPNSLFTVTGLNLEHIFDGDQDLRGDVKVTFEPRNAPMTFTKISDSEAELHQPAPERPLAAHVTDRDGNAERDFFEEPEPVALHPRDMP
jgi:hypothetical protein